MKKLLSIKTVLGFTLLTVAIFTSVTDSNAQRFNHTTFNGSRPNGTNTYNTPPIVNHPPQNNTPAPVVNHPQTQFNNHQQPAYIPTPVRQELQQHHEYINGGSYNNGHHDYYHHENIIVHENLNIHRYEHENINVYHTGSYRGLHPYAYHPFHPYYFGPRWHPMGFFLETLAFNAIRISIGNQWYYYDNGCYFQTYHRGYTVVAPPIGAVVNYLPEGYETTMVGNDYFYYYGGAFYITIGDRYQVVQAPYGAVINQLPVGAVEQNFNGVNLLVYNNTYFEPIYLDGHDAYEVVPIN